MKRSVAFLVAALALAELLVDDFLVVDMGLPCDQPAYLEIERPPWCSGPRG